MVSIRKFSAGLRSLQWSEAMLEADRISKKYGDFVALHELSFRVESGEILGLIGENGAGKSTTLRILSGLIKPSSGEVRYFGERMSEKVRSRIGYLPEVDALYDSMTPHEYLSFFAGLYDSGKGRIDDLLEMLKIPDRRISELSKGNRRKLSIARSLIHNPDILIYDEPTGGLDPGTSLFIAELMRDMAERGKIIIFSAHNMFYVERIADTVIIMKSGRALYHGSLKELLKERVVYRVRYEIDGRVDETSASSDVEKVVEKVREMGGKIIEIEKEVPRLEDIYFSLMAEG